MSYCGVTAVLPSGLRTVLLALEFCHLKTHSLQPGLHNQFYHHHYSLEFYLLHCIHLPVPLIVMQCLPLLVFFSLLVDIQKET